MLLNPRLPRVLMYHSVTRIDGGPTALCVSPERFKDQMLYLKRHNLRGVSMRELYAAMRRGAAEGLVGLTFDDGYEDFLDTVLPILKEFGFSATVFVVAGMLGEENSWEHHGESSPRLRLLGADGVREVSAQGMEVGAHSMSHPRLSNLRAEALEREVNESRRVLGEILGAPIEGFCYPYGNLNATAVRAVRRAGYVYACATKKHVEQSVHDWPRIFVGERDTGLRLWTKLKVYSLYSKVPRNLKLNPRARESIKR